MKSKILAISIAILLSGCAISKPTYLSDGSQGFSISCDGSAVGMNVCFEKAGEMCGSRGYDVLNKEGQIIYAGTSSSSARVNSSGGAAQSFGYFGAFNTKSILVKCK
jgi:hypothetical protein